MVVSRGFARQFSCSFARDYSFWRSVFTFYFLQSASALMVVGWMNMSLPVLCLCCENKTICCANLLSGARLQRTCDTFCLYGIRKLQDIAEWKCGDIWYMLFGDMLKIFISTIVLVEENFEEFLWQFCMANKAETDFGNGASGLNIVKLLHYCF